MTLPVKLGCHLACIGLLLATGRSLAIPAIEHFVAASGIRVYFVSAPEIPLLDIRVMFAAGSARDAATPGVAQLTSAVVKEGAGAHDADVFNERLATTGAKLSTGLLRDMAWVALRTLADREYRDPALALLGDVLARPRFDDVATGRQRARLMAHFQHEQQSPDEIAEKALFKAIYADHPYASPISGDATTMQALTTAEVRAFHQRYYVARNGVMAIVGAISLDEAKIIAESLTRDLRPGEPAPALPVVRPLVAPRVQHIEFPSLQTHVLIGQPGVKRIDPDYFPLLVGNHVLGGDGLVSMLSQEIREKRGLSYSVSSYFSPMAELGPFIASLQTNGRQRDEALLLLTRTLTEFVNNGPPVQGLTEAKQNLVGGFPLRISSNAKLVEYLAMIGFYGLPLDYLETFPGRVEEVTLEKVRDAFRRRIDPVHMVQVTVGQEPVPGAAARPVTPVGSPQHPTATGH